MRASEPGSPTAAAVEGRFIIRLYGSPTSPLALIERNPPHRRHIRLFATSITAETSRPRSRVHLRVHTSDFLFLSRH